MAKCAKYSAKMATEKFSDQTDLVEGGGMGAVASAVAIIKCNRQNIHL